MSWSWLGTVDYSQGLALQAQAVRRRQSGEVGDHIFLLEHPHVFTVGRGGSSADVLWDAEERRRRGVEIFHVDRGGEVTYHGPGQLVGYAVVDVATRGRDLHAFMRALEEVVIRTLSFYGVSSQRRRGLTGVWVGDAKIAAAGVHVSRWVTSHGFALNVTTDLAYFTGIVPCGQRDGQVTSILRELGRALPLSEVAAVAGRVFDAVFAVA